LDKNSLKILKGRLVGLSKMGVEFMLSTRLSATIPRVVWPGKTPNYTEAPSGDLIKFVDFQWRGNAFVCPNCAETFVFKRMGNPLTRYLRVKEESVSKPEATEPKIITDAIPEEKPVQMDESDVVELPPLTAEPAAIEETGEVVELAPIEDVAEESPETLEPIDILECPGEVQDAPAAVAEVAGAEGELLPEPEPVVVDEAAAQSDVCNLFLTSIPADKKLKAAELIAKIKNIPVKQAEVLTTRLLVPILKEVPEKDAAKCLEEFHKFGIRGKVVKKS